MFFGSDPGRLIAAAPSLRDGNRLVTPGPLPRRHLAAAYTMTSLWLQQAAPLSSDRALPATADVVVIGAGIAGVSAALHLRKRGASVCVLDAGEVSGRASGRNDGQLLLGLGEHYNRITGQFGDERARLLWDFIRRNHEATRRALDEYGIECELHQDGGLRLAETEHEARELDEAAALLAGEGIAHERLDNRALAERFPAAVGYHGALFLPGEAILAPVEMVRGLARAAQASGASFVQHAKVLGIDGQAGDFVVRIDNDRSIQTSAIVQCTSTLAPELDPTGFLQRHVFPFRGQVIATDPLPADVRARFPRCAMSSNFCWP